MKEIERIESLLQAAPLPCVEAGPHREQLKRRLLDSPDAAQPRRMPMRIASFKKMSSLMKLSTVALAVVILIGTGLAAEKIYEKLKFSRLSIIFGREDLRKEFTLPDGTILFRGHFHGSTSVDANDPNAIEKSRQFHEEMKQLIAQKKYKFCRTMDLHGTTQYLYLFYHAGDKHQHMGMNFEIPLENVTSWEDYLDKCDQRHEKIYKAVLAGNFRLLDCHESLVHFCRDVESGEKIEVTHIRLEDGKELAMALLALPEGVEWDSEAAVKPRPEQQTSWKKHLDLIRKGKRELLDMKSHKTYTYEATLADGSQTTFNVNKPLKKPAQK
jgi:hypothetical protein